MNNQSTGDIVLTRADGKSMRQIPSSDTHEDANPIKNSVSDTSQDGFKTQICCCWCSKTIKDVYIPEYKDGKNGEPYRVVCDYEPCPSCRAKWNTMVVFIEVDTKPPYPDCLPIAEDIRPLDEYINPVTNPAEYAARVIREAPDSNNENHNPVQYERILFYPTGRYAGVTCDAIKQCFTGGTDTIHNGSVIYLETEYFDKAVGSYFEK